MPRGRQGAVGVARSEEAPRAQAAEARGMGGLVRIPDNCFRFDQDHGYSRSSNSFLDNISRVAHPNYIPTTGTTSCFRLFAASLTMSRRGYPTRPHTDHGCCRACFRHVRPWPHCPLALVRCRWCSRPTTLLDSVLRRRVCLQFHVCIRFRSS